MAESSEESRRVSVQISSLSTQLIESIDKQSQLEERLNQARRTIQTQKSAIDKYEVLKDRSAQLEETLIAKEKAIQQLREELEKEKSLRTTAQDSIDELNKEIEDLTASLFDEANNMVATARKESHATEIKNSKLKEQLREKDSILDTLNIQLKNLKKVIQNLEKESSNQPNLTTKNSVLGNDNSTSSSVSLDKSSTSNSNRTNEQSLGPIFSPNMTAIRYDLALYNEFLKFIAVLPHCEALKETSSDSKLLRRLVNDEIQPILRLDNASGLGWIVRRTLMSLMMEGLVVVEPLSGLNENFQYGYSSPTLANSSFNPPPGSGTVKDSHLFNFPSDSPPIAVHDKCSFCSEARDDIIEHARLYTLKTQNRLEDGSIVVTNNFPLCRYCLLKVRQTCEIFAFLRSLKLGAWNLEKVTLTTIAKRESGRFSEVSKGNKELKTEDKRSQRMSFMPGLNSGSKFAPHVETPVDQAGAPTTNIQRAWLQLCKLRSTLHWTHIGIWSVDDSIGQKIGPFISSDDDQEDDNDQPLSFDEEERHKQKTAGSDEESFTLRKEGDGDDTENEAFDFEAGDSSLTTIENKQIIDNDVEKLPPNQSEQSANVIETENLLSSIEAVDAVELEKDPKNVLQPHERNSPRSTQLNDLVNTDQVIEVSNLDHHTESSLPRENLRQSNDPNKSTSSDNQLIEEDEKHKSDTRNDSGSVSNNDDEFDDAKEVQEDNKN